MSNSSVGLQSHFLGKVLRIDLQSNIVNFNGDVTEALGLFLHEWLSQKLVRKARPLRDPKLTKTNYTITNPNKCHVTT